jgi:hypothetical protein
MYMRRSNVSYQDFLICYWTLVSSCVDLMQITGLRRRTDLAIEMRGSWNVTWKSSEWVCSVLLTIRIHVTFEG